MTVNNSEEKQTSRFGPVREVLKGQDSSLEISRPSECRTEQEVRILPVNEQIFSWKTTFLFSLRSEE
jgi:hypothetical protein